LRWGLIASATADCTSSSLLSISRQRHGNVMEAP
jgi:hypothetical protein